jgi:hypothetical protein
MHNLARRTKDAGYIENTDSSIKQMMYIEVKTTRFRDNNVFEVSLPEWDFATRNPKVRSVIIH